MVAAFPYRQSVAEAGNLDATSNDRAPTSLGSPNDRALHAGRARWYGVVSR